MSEVMQHYVPSAADERLIARAMKVVEKQFMAAENSPNFLSPSCVIDYLRLQLWDHGREHFLVLFLDNKNRLIASEKLFSGTLTHIEVHPRIIARKGLLLNSARIILAHNHPSGDVFPSKADRLITQKIQEALVLLDIQVLDHIIINVRGEYWSFADHGDLDRDAQQAA